MIGSNGTVDIIGIAGIVILPAIAVVDAYPRSNHGFIITCVYVSKHHSFPTRRSSDLQDSARYYYTSICRCRTVIYLADVAGAYGEIGRRNAGCLSAAGKRVIAGQAAIGTVS